MRSPWAFRISLLKDQKLAKYSLIFTFFSGFSTRILHDVVGAASFYVEEQLTFIPPYKSAELWHFTRRLNVHISARHQDYCYLTFNLAWPSKLPQNYSCGCPTKKHILSCTSEHMRALWIEPFVIRKAYLCTYGGPMWAGSFTSQSGPIGQLKVIRRQSDGARTIVPNSVPGRPCNGSSLCTCTLYIGIFCSVPRNRLLETFARYFVLGDTYYSQ